jgi:hypothetical protein
MMLITKYFVFLHMQKTGGSFVAHACYRKLPREWRFENDLDPHGTYGEIPEQFRDLPVLCFVRNPWDWYVSWYHWLIANPPEGPHTLENTPMWVSAFDRGRAGFRETVWRACSGEGFRHRFTEPLMRELDIDHYSAEYLRKVGTGIEDGRIDVGKYENLRDDVLAFMHGHRVPITREFEEEIRTGAPRRASERGSYRSYYDDELRDLVGYKARAIIDRYGYSF